MWIRTQNRTQLQDVNRFVIEQFEIGIYIVGNGCTLGRYSTKEKALKVLDEIQTCIMTEHQYHTDEANCTMRFFTKEYKEIYQMPQDEDVEV
nr:MAG TPA: hypothetical protein [Caudoviricetes sp.]